MAACAPVGVENDKERGKQEDITSDLLKYMTWENAQKLLRTGKHSLRLEHEFLTARAAADQQYADSLEKMAADLRTALRHDELMEYEPHKDVLWCLAEEATHAARFHHRVATHLTDAMGPAAAIKRIRDMNNHKKITSFATKKSQQIDYFHDMHKNAYDSLLEEIIGIQMLAGKYDKLMEKAVQLGQKVQVTQAKHQNAFRSEEKVTVHREETHLLGQESVATCIHDKHNSRVRRLVKNIPIISSRSVKFFSNIMYREQERLKCIFSQVSNYLKCVTENDSEREDYKQLMADTKVQLEKLDPVQIVSNWTDKHTEYIEIPNILGCNENDGKGKVTTLLKANQGNPYGHRDSAVEMFSVDYSSGPTHCTESPSCWSRPSSRAGPSPPPQLDFERQSIRSNDRKSTRSGRGVNTNPRVQTPLDSPLANPREAINLDGVHSDITEVSPRQEITAVESVNHSGRSSRSQARTSNLPSPRLTKAAWIDGFDSIPSNNT